LALLTLCDVKRLTEPLYFLSQILFD